MDFTPLTVEVSEETRRNLEAIARLLDCNVEAALEHVIHRQKFSSAVKLEVVRVKTNFRAHYRGSFDWGPLVNKLVRNEERNELIAEIADREIEEGNSVLVLSRRIEHLQAVAEAMSSDVEISRSTSCRTEKSKRDR